MCNLLEFLLELKPAFLLGLFELFRVFLQAVHNKLFTNISSFSETINKKGSFFEVYRSGSY